MAKVLSMRDYARHQRADPPLFKIIDGKRITLIDVDALDRKGRDDYFASRGKYALAPEEASAPMTKPPSS